MKSVCLIGFGSTVSVPLLLGKEFDCYVVNDTQYAGGHVRTLVAEVIETKMDNQSKSTWQKPTLKDWQPDDIKRIKQKFKNEDIFDDNGTRVGTKKTYYIPVETGTEFIGTKDFYPVTHREFSALGIETKHYQLAVEFDNLTDNSADVMLGGSTCDSCSGFFSKQTIDPAKLKKTIQSLRAELLTLLVSISAIQIDEKQKRVLTLNEFAALFIEKGICFGKADRREFVNKILYPELMASYGVSRKKIGTFTANDVLNYIVVGVKGWEEIETGLSTYVHRVTEECQKLANTHFVPPQKAAKLEACKNENGELCYKVKLADGTYVLDKDTKEPKLFDFVMLGTNAEIMKDLLPDKNDAEIISLKAALGKATYYTSNTMFHADTTYSKQSQTRVYIAYDSTPGIDVACLNRSKPELYPEGAPIVQNLWVSPGMKQLPAPDKQLDFTIPYFRHMDLDNNFRDAQHAVQHFQKEYAAKHKIVIGGVVGGFNDSTESAKQANCRAVLAIRNVAGVRDMPKFLQDVMPVAPSDPTKFEGKQLGADPDLIASSCNVYCC